MQCRAGCGACCIAPSITSPIPGMPQGKPAGVRCVQLTADLRCAIFGQPERPAVCRGFSARLETCGHSRDEAMARLDDLERLTAPPPPTLAGSGGCRSPKAQQSSAIGIGISHRLDGSP